MNQTHLSYFILVYKYKNISKAADEIHISRQALSKIINALEREMDARLFNRTQDGLVPTDIGSDLYHHAEIILHEFEAIQNINYLEKLRKKEVTIYAFDAIIELLTADFFIQFSNKHPDIILNIQEATDEDAKTRLILNQCDLAIVTDAIDLSNVNKTFLFHAQYSVIINKDNPLSQKKVLKFEDFNSQKLIGKSSELKYYCRDVNKKINNNNSYNFVIELNNTHIREELVKKNFGIALVWDYTIIDQRTIDNCVIRPLYNEGWGTDVFLLEANTPSKKENCEIVKKAIMNWILSHSID